MKLPYSEPDPAGSERARKARAQRNLATEISRLTPQALTRTNDEEADFSPTYPSNFTKGLKHNAWGLVEEPEAYRCFVEAINAPDPTLFEKQVVSASPDDFHCKPKKGEPFDWRGWESPRSGHVYELQGPDAGAVGMAPAPRIASSELAAEMAEVYALALLRDVPFTTIAEGGGRKFCASNPRAGNAELSAQQLVKLLNSMPFYSGKGVKSSTPHQVDETGFNRFERNRRFGRTLSLDGKLTPASAFRGSTKGAHAGPYISQFMLIGAGGTLKEGLVPYGSLCIDQRTQSQKNCLDYMTSWCEWLDVQNGADLRGLDLFEKKKRFIATPRDLATYVHFDALYEAYLNACLIMLAMGVPNSKGFPETSPSGRRTPFATFGGPHILSLVCEVATRCLKAVRRQKFNYHRRARPEAMGGRFTLACAGGKTAQALGCSEEAFDHALAEFPAALRKAITDHNRKQNALTHRPFDCRGNCLPRGLTAKRFDACNLLLPMAFPEGSPMHPAYGAGHATVAGGCVTMLKAFFEMYDDCDSFKERELRVNADGRYDSSGSAVRFVPNADGSALVGDGGRKALTIQGELDKLAANISIGRNMAGVHYYSDYYDSLRMGERIAVGILMEQAPTYNETVACTFKSFDGDHVTILGEGESCPSLSMLGADGSPVSPEDWWLRHVSGQEFSEDL
ncbi:MAG: bromoperoxidase [Pseudomonadota bacterium]